MTAALPRAWMYRGHRRNLRRTVTAPPTPQRTRPVLEHATATLTGTPASSFSLPPDVAFNYLPHIPTGRSATLLQRRPDVAAAERRVAAANATIGVAKGAFFPDISLGLDGGYQSDTFSPWLAAPNEMWSVGPQMLFTIF